MDGLPGFEMTTKKVMNLKPIIESILSRKYGKEVKFKDFTIGEIKINCDKEGE